MDTNNKLDGEKRGLIYAIIGVAVLVIAVAGSAYAYYQASITDTTNVRGTAGVGDAPGITVSRVSAGTGNLIPVYDNQLSTAAVGDTGKGSCVDKNGNTVCQVYSVVVTNNTTVATAYNITLTISGVTNMPNLRAVQMTGPTAVSSGPTFIGSTGNNTINNAAVCTTNSVTGTASAGTSTTACYFMVYIRNTGTVQTDKGSFTGTVTATSTIGNGKVEAQFSS